jgi:hypothetical protein
LVLWFWLRQGAGGNSALWMAEMVLSKRLDVLKVNLYRPNRR